ncbi:hypothetical protein FGO68_gene7925 [Halteria grandinella]|uniref:Transmembrane protein n=1 Tax=Halteria grandinella TaxID=5974 RepID=A0A8J8NFM9_HALGN|nr:hypothetical protein FGO68_gene7925 [Halteria grandinella]
MNLLNQKLIPFQQKEHFKFGRERKIKYILRTQLEIVFYSKNYKVKQQLMLLLFSSLPILQFCNLITIFMHFRMRLYMRYQNRVICQLKQILIFYKSKDTRENGFQIKFLEINNLINIYYLYYMWIIYVFQIFIMNSHLLIKLLLNTNLMMQNQLLEQKHFLQQQSQKFRSTITRFKTIYSRLNNLIMAHQDFFMKQILQNQILVQTQVIYIQFLIMIMIGMMNTVFQCLHRTNLSTMPVQLNLLLVTQRLVLLLSQVRMRQCTFQLLQIEIHLIFHL